MRISIDQYNTQVDKFLAFTSSHDILGAFYKHFFWVRHFPGLTVDIVEPTPTNNIMDSLYNFAERCNQHVRKMAMSTKENSIHHLQVYRDVLIQRFDPVTETWIYYSKLSKEGQAALQVLFLRTFNPLNGLATVNAEMVLTSDEIQCLLAIEIKHLFKTMDSNEPSWSSNAGIQYNGYGCFIFKITRLCNLRCIYCHDWREGPGNTMQVQDIFKMLGHILSSQKFTTIEIVWHGGEPTLFGLSKMYKILYAIQQLKLPSQQVKHTIQTNGLALSAVWIDFFKTFAFSVGISIDGPDYIHDANRPDVKQRPTFHRVTATINKLRESAVPINIIMVGNEAVIQVGGRKMINFLQDLSIDNCCILPLLPGNCKAVDTFSYKEYRKKYFDFIFDLFREREKLAKRIGIREIDTLLDILSGKNPQHCELLGNCIGTFYSVDPNGEVYHCDKYVRDEKFRVGNLLEKTIDQIATGPKINLLKKENIHNLSAFSSCKYFKQCAGWCPHESYLRKLYNVPPNGCCGLNYILSRLENTIKHLQIHG